MEDLPFQTDTVPFSLPDDEYQHLKTAKSAEYNQSKEYQPDKKFRQKFKSTLVVTLAFKLKPRKAKKPSCLDMLDEVADLEKKVKKRSTDRTSLLTSFAADDKNTVRKGFNKVNSTKNKTLRKPNKRKKGYPGKDYQQPSTSCFKIEYSSDSDTSGTSSLMPFLSNEAANIGKINSSSSKANCSFDSDMCGTSNPLSVTSDAAEKISEINPSCFKADYLPEYDMSETLNPTSVTSDLTKKSVK